MCSSSTLRDFPEIIHFMCIMGMVLATYYMTVNGSSAYSYDPDKGIAIYDGLFR